MSGEKNSALSKNGTGATAATRDMSRSHDMHDLLPRASGPWSDGSFRQMQELRGRFKLQAIQDLLVRMSHLRPPIPDLRCAARNGQDIATEEYQRQRYALPCLVYRSRLRMPMDSILQKSFIDILDDDSLLHIFSLYRPVLLAEDHTQNSSVLLGGEWNRECWWYKLVHVCRRWRYLILASSSGLGICLVCKHDTPIAYMLTHSPSLPLIIDYLDGHRSITSEDEEGILLALQHHDRVRRIRLMMPVPALQKIIIALGKRFPMLEYLYVATLTDEIPNLVLPETFQAPQLRHLTLTDFALPITSPSLTTAMGLVTLWLSEIPPSSYFRPSAFLRHFSFMPQLETLGILFHSPAPGHEDEEKLFHTPNSAHLTLLRLHLFAFGGDSTYLEALLPRMAIPALEELQISFFDQQTFSVPHLRQFASARENLTASCASLIFGDENVFMTVYSDDKYRKEKFYIDVSCGEPYRQVTSAAQIFSALGTILSGVEYLFLGDENGVSSFPWDNEADSPQWRGLLKSFENVKAMKVPRGVLKMLSRSLQFGDGESPVEFLPRLEQLECYDCGGTGIQFTGCIDVRRNPGHPVTFVARSS